MERRIRRCVRQVAPALALTMVGAVACLQPSLPGYQVQDVPEGFLFRANANTGTNAFPDREALSRGVWMGDIDTFEPQSEIYVTRYAGNITVEEAEAARGFLLLTPSCSCRTLAETTRAGYDRPGGIPQGSTR